MINIGNMLGIGGQSSANRNLDTIQGQQRDLAGMSIDQLKGLTPQQTQFGQQLAQSALGQGPSITEAQLQTAMDKNLQQQIAAANSNRSVNPALAARNVANAAGNMNRDLGAQSGAMRLQEQQQNQAQFSNYLGQLNGGITGNLNSAAGINQNMQAGNNQMVGGLMSAVGAVGAAAVKGGAAHGALVQGTENVPGDSTANDTQHYMLSPGEAVVPKTVVNSGPEAVASFVEALKKHQNAITSAPSDSGPKGFAAVLAAYNEMSTRLEKLEGKKAKKD